MQTFDVVVIGQGYAGLKAASLAASHGLKVATIEAMFPGGLVMSINELDPAPAGEVASGPELTGGIAMENMDAGIVNMSGEVSSITRDQTGSWRVEAVETVSTGNVILASGARLKKLGVPGEAEFEGRGVSSCADCDGPIYMGQDAVIIGGGDSAFQEAVALTHYAGKVTIVMRGATPKAREALVNAVAAHPKITVIAETTVTEIVGEQGVTGVRLAGANGTSDILPSPVVFAFIGLEPNGDFIPGEVARGTSGGVVVDHNLQTSLPGLWAIGAVREGYGGMLSDAAADAEKVVAALT